MPYQLIGPSGRIENTTTPIKEASTTMQNQYLDPFKTNGSSPPVWRSYYDDFDPALDAALHERISLWNRRGNPRDDQPDDQYVYLRGEVAVAFGEYPGPRPEDVAEWVAEVVLSSNGLVRVVVRALGGRIVPSSKLAPDTAKALRAFGGWVHKLARECRIARIEADQ